MAKVDTDNLCLLRHEEYVLVPEKGAKLGNFGVEHVSDTESWITATEWMQPIGCEKYGSIIPFTYVKSHGDIKNYIPCFVILNYECTIVIMIGG